MKLFSKEVVTGFVVVITLIGFYALYNYMKGKDLFSSGRTYYVQYEDVNGLVVAKPVSVNGYKVGTVEDVELKTDQAPFSFVVTLKLDRGLTLTNQTIAEIYEPGLMSGTEVRLLTSQSGEVITGGSFILGRVKPSLGDTFSKELGPTKDKVDSLIVSLQGTLEGVDKMLDTENQENLKNILQNLNSTVVSFEETSKSITQTSEGVNQLVSDNNEKIKQVLVSADSALKEFDSLAGKLNNLELEKITKNLESVSVKLDDILSSVEDGKGTLGALVNDKELYDNLLRTSNSLDALLGDLKENPNRYVQFSIFGKKAKPAKAE